MMGEYITMKDVIEGYEDRILLEEKEKVNKDYINQSLDHSVILISPEIDSHIGSNKTFEATIKTALSEITNALDEEYILEKNKII